MPLSSSRYLLPVLAIAVAACGDDETAPLSPSPSPVETFMTHYFEVFDGYVLEDILALYAPEVSADISGLGALEGIDAVRDEWLVPFTSAFPSYAHEVKTLSVDGALASADFVFRGVHEGPLLGKEPTGKELVLPIAGSYEIEGERVVAFTLEYDLAIVLDTITP